MSKKVLPLVILFGCVSAILPLFAQNSDLTCANQPATIYVDETDIVHGGDDDGEIYNGILRGTFGEDVIVGTALDDTIFGSESDDIICGGDGDDDIYGGRGSDDLYGERGSDNIYGERDDDVLDGDRGDDILCGGRDEDDVIGGRDNDIIQVDGTDVVDTSSGNDILVRLCGTPTSVDMQTATPTPTGDVTPSPEQANLTFITVVLEPATPNCDQGLKVITTVTNIGTVAATNIAISVADEFNGQIPVEVVEVLPGLNPGQTVTMTSPLAVLNDVTNEHTIVVTIDPLNEVTESNETDNVTRIPYQLAALCDPTDPPPLPNLTVELISLDPQTPTCGQEFMVSVTLTNIGTVTATDIEFLVIESVGSVDTVLTGLGLPELTPDEAVTITFPMTVFVHNSDDHGIAVFVDNFGKIPESNENDNVSQVGYQQIDDPIACGTAPITPTPTS